MREYLNPKEKLLLDYIYTRYKNTLEVKFRIPINDYSDIGSEFTNWREIESVLNCQMYFADLYCAWQKGINENFKGLLREFYPKGHNLSRVSPKTL